MTPESLKSFVEMARVLRRGGPVANLLPEVTTHLLSIVPADGVRYDLADERDRLWSRICKRGVPPERPGLGAVSRLKTREDVTQILLEGTHELSLPLGLGERVSGRLVLRRRSGPFTDEEVRGLQRCADLLSLALRSRPLEPPPKPMRFGEEPTP